MVHTTRHVLQHVSNRFLSLDINNTMYELCIFYLLLFIISTLNKCYIPTHLCLAKRVFYYDKYKFIIFHIYYLFLIQIVLFQAFCTSISLSVNINLDNDLDLDLDLNLSLSQSLSLSRARSVSAHFVLEASYLIITLLLVQIINH